MTETRFDTDALAVLADLGIASPDELRDAARARVPGWGLPAGPASGAAPDDGEADTIAAADVERVGGSGGIGTPRSPGRGATPEAAPGSGATRTATLTAPEAVAPAGTDGTPA